jgi:hypothetical protein
MPARSSRRSSPSRPDAASPRQDPGGRLRQRSGGPASLGRKLHEPERVGHVERIAKRVRRRGCHMPERGRRRKRVRRRGRIRPRWREAHTAALARIGRREGGAGADHPEVAEDDRDLAPEGGRLPPVGKPACGGRQLDGTGQGLEPQRCAHGCRRAMGERSAGGSREGGERPVCHATRFAGPHERGMNAGRARVNLQAGRRRTYPTPRTVCRRIGFAGSRSTAPRAQWMCTSTVRVSPA